MVYGCFKTNLSTVSLLAPPPVVSFRFTLNQNSTSSSFVWFRRFSGYPHIFEIINLQFMEVDYSTQIMFASPH